MARKPPTSSSRVGGGRSTTSTIKESLWKRQLRESDVEWMTYVRPVGNRRLHLVLPDGAATPVHATDRTRATFRPGDIVGVIRHTGSQGYAIVSGAPPGAIGAGPVQRLDIDRTPEQVGCPPLVRDNLYLAVYEEFAASSVNPHRIHFFKYADGTLIESLGYFEAPSGSPDAGYPVEVQDIYAPIPDPTIIGDEFSESFPELSGPYVLARNGLQYFVLDVGRIGVDPNDYAGVYAILRYLSRQPFKYLGTSNGPTSFPPAAGYLGTSAGEIYAGETVSNHLEYWTLGLAIGPGFAQGVGFQRVSAETGGPSGRNLYAILDTDDIAGYSFSEFQFRDRSVTNAALPYSEFQRDHPSVGSPSIGIPWRSAAGVNYLLWRDHGGGDWHSWVATIGYDEDTYNGLYQPAVEVGELLRLVERDIYLPGGSVHNYLGDSIGYPVPGGALRVVGNQQEFARTGGLSSSLRYVTFFPDDETLPEYQVFQFTNHAIMHSTIAPDGDLVFTVAEDVDTNDPPVVGGFARYSMPNAIPSSCGDEFIPCDPVTIPPNSDADDSERVVVPNKFLPLT